MKPIEKHKLDKILEKVDSGQFDENDIDNLFIKLRPYYRGFRKFKEISDFVAHNDERDRGLLNQTLEHWYLMIKYYVDYVYEKDAETLNIGKPFPSWIIKLVKFQAKNVDKRKFLQDNKQSVTSFLKKVDQLFKINNEEKTAIYNSDSISDLFLNGLKDCLNFISFRSAFNQDELIKEIIGVLKANKIKFNENNIKLYSDKITVCTILLMHNASYTYNGMNLGTSYITYKNLVEITQGFDPNIDFGNLLVGGSIAVRTKTGDELKFGGPLMFTNLNAEEWCSPELVSIEVKEDGRQIKVLNLEENLVLNHIGKISIKY